METYRDVIQGWPDREALAHDVGTTTEAVRKWWERDRIPPEYWSALIQGAAGRRIRGVTAAALASIAASQRRAA